jgi:hypothetical protein
LFAYKGGGQNHCHNGQDKKCLVFLFHICLGLWDYAATWLNLYTATLPKNLTIAAVASYRLSLCHHHPYNIILKFKLV